MYDFICVLLYVWFYMCMILQKVGIIQYAITKRRAENMGGILEIDCHNMTAEAAVNAVEKMVNTAPAGTYRVRVIHGYNGGTRIRDAIRRELGYGLNSKIIRIENGSNQGITELVLREY